MNIPMIIDEEANKNGSKYDLIMGLGELQTYLL
jgi:hypothetical protein